MRPFNCCVFLLGLLAASASAGAETKFDAAASAKAIAPFVEEETAAIAHVDLTRIALEPTFELLVRLMADAPVDFRNDAALERLNMFRRAGMKEFYLVALGGQGWQPRMIAVVPIPPGVDEKALRTAMGVPTSEAPAVNGALVLSVPAGSTQPPVTFRPVERPEVMAAFEAAGDSAAQILLIPPTYARRVVEELMPPLPKELGDGPSSVWTRGIIWAAAGIDFPPQSTLRLVIKSQDAQAAEAFRTKLAEVLRLAGEHKEVREVVPKYDEVAALLAPKVEGDRLLLALNQSNQGVEKLLSALTPPIELARARVARRESVNNLKYIGLAMHNYHDANKHLPLPASRSPDGKPLLSWRVLVLPYVDNGPALFKQFHLDEPWDSPHNRTLIDKMPAIYRMPVTKNKEKGLTNYLLPVGNGAVFTADKPTEFKDIVDGTAHTIMVVEVDDEHAVIWTKPDDWPFDPNDPAKGLGHFFDGCFNTTFCDGSVHTLKLPQDPKNLQNLRALFTRAGRDPFELW